MRREDFLDRVRVAAQRALLPEAPSHDPGLLVPDLEHEDELERFTQALEAADGILHRRSPVDVLVELAADLGVDRFIGWDDEHLGSPGLVDDLAAQGLHPVPYRVPPASPDAIGHQTDYMDIRLGVTGAEAGFAETGTIVVRSGAGRPRMASLIPDVHVALLKPSEIRPSLAHWAAEDPGRMATASNVVFITGPSRTGDIEMRLNKGVHGPRELHVVLV